MQTEDTDHAIGYATRGITPGETIATVNLSTGEVAGHGIAFAPGGEDALRELVMWTPLVARLSPRPSCAVSGGL